MNNTIKEIIGDVLELSEDILEHIKGSSDLTEYGLDSMTCVELIVNIEEEFGITVDEEDLLVENMSSINKIKGLIEKYQ